MSIQRQSHLTPEEYLALERTAEYKSEYFAGEIFAMAGASERHVSIVANLMYILVGQLKGRPCKAYANDLRLKVSPTGLYTYPDVLVVCGAPRFADEQHDTLLNPVVLMEVLSESTEAYDRGKKFDHYRALPSVSDYLLVSQDQHKIEHFIRQSDNRWLFSAYMALDDVVEIPSIAGALPLRDVYDKVELAGEILDAEDNRSDRERQAQDTPPSQLGGLSPAEPGTGADAQ
jgi:Uma2 family endonuclease